MSLVFEKKSDSLFPIQYEDIWGYKKKIEGLSWTAQEVDLSTDYKSWLQLSDEDKKFIIYQLAFFARADLDIIDIIEDSLFDNPKNLPNELKAYYDIQKAQEWVHAESYSLQIDTLIKDDEEKYKLLNAVKYYPEIKLMQEWIMSHMSNQSEKLVTMAFIEGVMFSASFCSLQWLRERNVLNGITEMNDFISRDEYIHMSNTCNIIRKYLQPKPSFADIKNLVDSLFIVMKQFVDACLCYDLMAMNKTLMCQYIKYQIDQILVEMGYTKYYGTENPFPFMDKLLLNKVKKVNFFEHRSFQYQQATSADSAEFAIEEL